jgi:hypothetical protein
VFISSTPARHRQDLAGHSGLEGSTERSGSDHEGHVELGPLCSQSLERCRIRFTRAARQGAQCDGRFGLTPYLNYLSGSFDGGNANVLQVGLGVNWYWRSGLSSVESMKWNTPGRAMRSLTV